MNGCTHEELWWIPGEKAWTMCPECDPPRLFRVLRVPESWLRSGKDGRTSPDVAAQASPVPANLGDVGERVPSVPSAPPGSFYHCPGLGEPGDEYYVAGHSAKWHLTERGPWPGALCTSCYGVVQRLKRVVGSR